MAKISEILSQKGDQVHSVDADATVFEAIKKMVDKNAGSVIVTRGDSIVGIFTERDYLRRIVLENRTSKATPVGEVMTSALVCVNPTESVEDCMGIMTQKRIRHLPVMHAERLVGVVSIGDLVKHLSKEREIEIRYLTDYITGKYPG